MYSSAKWGKSMIFVFLFAVHDFMFACHAENAFAHVIFVVGGTCMLKYRNDRCT